MGSKNLSVSCDYGDKELQNKFIPMLIYCQRWYHNEKTETSITFALDVVLTSEFFLKAIFFESVSFKKIKFHALSGMQDCFKYLLNVLMLFFVA